MFHTALGHADYSMKCVGFITTLKRGAEWAATGKVTIPPKDFPTAEKSQSIKRRTKLRHGNDGTIDRASYRK